MGIFGKVFKKNDDFLDKPLDLGSKGDPMGGGADPMAGSSNPMGASDAFGGDSFGNSSFSNDLGSQDANDPFASSASQSGFNDPMGMPQPDFSKQSQNYPQNPGYPGQTQQQHHYEDETPSRDVELILAKLDAIKAELDSVHQRVRKLEGIADGKQPQQKKYMW